MESTMESPMPSVSSMTSSIPSPPEMKPDITNLNSPTSTQGGATGFSPSSTQPGPPHGFFPHSMQTTASQMSHMGGGHMSSQMSPTGPAYPGKTDLISEPTFDQLSVSCISCCHDVEVTNSCYFSRCTCRRQSIVT